MKQDLNKLYPEIIKAHNSSPYHFEKRAEGELISAYNPICGDRFEFFIMRESNKLNELYFHGFGCSVSKASASVLAQTLEGKTIDEAIGLCNHFLKFVSGETSQDDSWLSNEFLAFSGVRDFPERLECATLAWKEMKKFLERKNSVQ